MGFALLIIGLLMVITGARGTYAQFGAQVASEFTGQNNFTYWILAIGSIGALGYIPEIRTISRYLMALVIIVLFLDHKGFFAQFQSALSTGPKQPNAIPLAASGSPTTAAGQPATNAALIAGQGTSSAPSLYQSFLAGNGAFWNFFNATPIAPTGQ